MQIQQGNIIDQFGKYEFVLATTNGVVTSAKVTQTTSRLVMGRGNAAAIDNATDNEFSVFAGEFLRLKYPTTWNKPHMLQYGFELPHSDNCIYRWDWHNPKGYFRVNNSALGLLQVKRHYSTNAELALLQFSIEELCSYVQRDPLCTIACPMPAIGAGNLPMDDVVRALLPVPNNVTFYIL